MKSIDEIRKDPAIQAVGHDENGLFGFVRLRKSGKPRDYSFVVGVNEGGMEHVSISCSDRRHIPVWDEMCELKDICFPDSEEAFQVHPERSEYVNIVSNCLHLWRHNDGRSVFNRPVEKTGADTVKAGADTGRPREERDETGKMTEDKLIMALECCQSHPESRCSECPMYSADDYQCDCLDRLMQLCVRYIRNSIIVNCDAFGSDEP